MATQLKPNSRYSEAEWTARQELAACYRIFSMFGWDELIYNHITVKVPSVAAYGVAKNAAALARLQELATALGVPAVGVPAFHLRGRSAVRHPHQYPRHAARRPRRCARAASCPTHRTGSSSAA